jgi:hypothetical protein
MKKYLIETISSHRCRYVVEANNEFDAVALIDHLDDMDINEFSQMHLGEEIQSSKEIDDEEYLRLFDEDNRDFSCWSEELKLSLINKVDYTEVNKFSLDSDEREWEYDGTGVRVYKGTRTPYHL